MNTNNQKATARPWKECEHLNGFKIEVIADNGIVCTVAGTSGSVAETKANAALIVQAVNERAALLVVAESANALEIVATKMLAGGFNGRMADMHKAVGEAAEATRNALAALRNQGTK